MFSTLALTLALFCQQPDYSLDNLPQTGVVCFSATWCAPCRVAKRQIVRPMQRAGWTIIDVDCDKHCTTVTALGVEGIPLFIAVKHGRLAGRYQGVELGGVLKLFDLKPIVSTPPGRYPGTVRE